MNTYVMLVLGTVIISSLLTAILPSGKMQSAVKGSVKILCVITIISPIFLFFTNQELGITSRENLDGFFLSSGLETDSDFIKYYSEQRIRNAERLLQEELEKHFKVKAEVEFVCLTVETEVLQLYYNSQIKIEEIKIILQENINEVIQEQMLAYIKENYCSEVLLE